MQALMEMTLGLRLEKSGHHIQMKSIHIVTTLDESQNSLRLIFPKEKF
jgi:hypothetical protein